MRRADIPAGLRLSEAAGWNQTAADWQFFLESNPDGCRVAESGEGSVAATVVTVRFGTSLGWIAMVLVDPSHRRAGLGTRMLHEGLDLLSDIATIRLDATPDGRRVYAPLGFRDEYALQRMVCHPGAVPLAASGGDIEPMTNADFDAVLTLDAAVTGIRRGALLASLRRQAPEYALVVRDGSGTASGYMFGRHGRMYDHFGPIVATHAASACQLLRSGLQSRGNRGAIVDVPLREFWVRSLDTAGFVVERPFTRMYRGARHTGEHLEAIFAIAGPDFG
jgi:GNAT superfamily N-acetyltransferase